MTRRYLVSSFAAAAIFSLAMGPTIQSAAPMPLALSQSLSARQEAMQGTWHANLAREVCGLVFSPGRLLPPREWAEACRWRWYLSGDTLYLRYNRTLGMLSYLSEPLSFPVTLEPGKTLTLPLSVGGSVQPVLLEYAGPQTPYGDPLQMGIRVLEGRDVVISPSGEKEMWEFSDTGWAYLNRRTGYEAMRFEVKDNTLIIDGLMKDYYFPIRDFELGRGFIAGNDPNPYRFSYYDGPFWAPSADMPMPTKVEIERALAQEIAITQKATATSAAINSGIQTMSDVLDMMNDDIADRPYRYEWVPRN